MKQLIETASLVFRYSIIGALVFYTVSQASLQKENHESLIREADFAMNKGLEYLKGQQHPEGYWATGEYPAYTGLALYAFFTSKKFEGKKRPAFIQKGLDYLVSNVKVDGGIYVEDLPNYNTAISLMALVASGDPKYHDIILGARSFLPTLQLKKDEKDNPYNGGIGYGTKDHSDMSNTYLALEAIRMSRHLKQEKNKSIHTKELDWDAALAFIKRCQNLKGSNDQNWASNDTANKGGFVYFPGESKAGEDTLNTGGTALRSYGSMTYAGLLSLIYADVDKKDERVQAAYGWLKKNYTLDENPGAGQQGLYYYYHTMAKALSIYGEDHLSLAGGKKVNWRRELVTKLIQKQKGEGFWVNTNGRWQENNPVLVTCYSLIALGMTVPGL